MRIFFNSIIIQLLLNAYILWWIWSITSRYKLVRQIITALIGLEVAIYFSGFFFSDEFPLNVNHWLIWLTTTWMVFLVYFSGLLMGYDLLRLICLYTQKPLFGKIELHSLKLRTLYLLASFTLVVGGMIYGNYRFKHPVVNHYELSVDKKAIGIDSLKIVMVSDLHVGILIGNDMLHKYVDLIMAQKPDIIVLVGDIIDYDLASVKEQHLENEFRRLKAPYGVYASTGNHEYIEIKDEKKDEKINWLNDVANLTVLRDSVVKISNAFYLVGREDNRNEDRKQLDSLISNIDKSLPVIVLNHEPRDLDEEADNGADIALYGHTHNGQLFPYNIVLKAIYEVVYGYKKKQNTHVYVSSGLGLAGPQYRIGTLSEIVVLNIDFKKD